MVCKVELIAFNNSEKLKISQDELIIVINSINQRRTIKLSGEKYRNYIFPISNDLKKLNTSQYLLNTLIEKSELEINKDEFYNIINHLLNKNILLKSSPLQMCSDIKNPNLNYNNRKLNIAIFSIEDLYIALELAQKVEAFIKCNLTIFYNCSKDVQNMIRNISLSHNYTINSYEEENFDFAILLQFDLVIYFQANFIINSSRFVNSYCIKNNISFLVVTICDFFSLIGPFYLCADSICMCCTTKNRLIKSLMASQRYEGNYYRKKRNSLYLQNLFNIITLQIYNYYKTGYSSIVNSILYIDEELNFCHKFRLVKFSDCYSCIKNKAEVLNQ
jgi:hypothetical protein